MGRHRAAAEMRPPRYDRTRPGRRLPLTGVAVSCHWPAGTEHSAQRCERVVGKPATPDQVPDRARDIAVADRGWFARLRRKRGLHALGDRAEEQRAATNQPAEPRFG